jgi:RNA polymerase sigma-70 factor (ECF subfamily)
MEVKALSCGPPATLAVEGRAAGADPDAALVAAAQGDPTRFVALYDRYVARVHGYVRVRIRDAATCEDVTSQVFTTALAKLAGFRGGGSFGAWLFRIAQNAVHDVYRRQRVDPLPVAALDALRDGAPGPEEQALAEERAERLRTLLATLPPEQQHLLALRYGAGLSFEEIGRVVGKSTVAARVSIHRILQDLRRRYPYDE